MDIFRVFVCRFIKSFMYLLNYLFFLFFLLLTLFLPFFFLYFIHPDYDNDDDNGHSFEPDFDFGSASASVTVGGKDILMDSHSNRIVSAANRTGGNVRSVPRLLMTVARSRKLTVECIPSRDPPTAQL